jgi:hypothetical protein
LSLAAMVHSRETDPLPITYSTTSKLFFCPLTSKWPLR